MIPSWVQSERSAGGGSSGGMIMKVSSLFITTSHEKTNFTSDVCADFIQNTCCLDPLMHRVRVWLFPLVPAIINHISDGLSLNGFRWGTQPGVITFLHLFSCSFLFHYLVRSLFHLFSVPFHSLVRTSATRLSPLLMEIFRYRVMQCS